MLNVGQLKMDINSGKSWRTKEKVSILLGSELSSSILVPSSNSRTFRKCHQSYIARQCTVSRRFYWAYLFRRKRSRIEVQKWATVWFQEQPVSERADKLYSSLLWFRWIIKMATENPNTTSHKQESRHTRILGNAFRIQYFGATWSWLKREDCNFIKQGQTQSSSLTRHLQSSLRKRHAWRPRISFMKGKAWFWESVLFFKQIRSVVHKIHLYNKQGHLGNRNKMRRASEKPKATLMTQEGNTADNRKRECRMHGDKTGSQSWLRCSQGSSNFAKISQNINVLIAMLSPKSGSFIAVAGEIWSTRGVQQHSSRPIAILLQSLAWSLRRILLTDTPHTSLFLLHSATLSDVQSHHDSRMCLCASISMVIHDVQLIDRLFSLCSSSCSFPCVSPIPCSSLSTSTCALSWTCSSMWSTSRQLPTGTPPNGESGPLAEFTPPTGYEPKLPDDFHFSETTEIIFRDESSDAVPSYLIDAELDDETIGRALSSPLFVLWTPHLTRRIFSLIHTHMRGSRRVFVAHHLSCVIVMCWFWLSSTTPLSHLRSPSSLLSFCPSSCPSTSSSTVVDKFPCALSLMRTLAPLPSATLSQVMSPTTTTSRRLLSPNIQESSVENGSPNDFEFDDVIIGKASPLYTQEREDDARRGRAYHSQEEGLSSSQSWQNGETRCETVWLTHFKCSRYSEPQLRKWANQDSSATTKRADSRSLSSRDSKTRIPGRLWQNKNSKKFNGVIESQRGEIYRAQQGDERLRRDQQLLHELLLKQNWDLREAHKKSLREIEELKRFQGSTFDTIARKKFVEDRDTILELTGKIQELQNEINCMNESRDFQDAESEPRGHSHVTSQPVYFPPHPNPGGMLSRSLGMPSCKKWAAKHLGHTWYIGKRFANPTASSSAPYPQESNPTVSNASEHTSPHVMSESQTPVQDQRCQSRPSGKNSFIPSEGGFSKNYGADQQRLQILDLHFDKIPHASNIRLLEDKIQDWGMYLFTISYGSYAVDQGSGVGWFSGWFKIFCERTSHAEFWSTRCGDCFCTEQNHPYYPLQKKGQSGGTKSPKRGPLPSWKTGRLPDLRVLPGHWSQRFCRELCRPIYNCSSKFKNSIWNGTEFHYQWRKSHLNKLRIRESEKLKTVLELYNMEIRQKKAGPDYHRLKTMVKRSIDQNLRIKNLRQKRKLLKKRHGQESGDKTVWTKDPRSFLAMENQRAVF